MENFQVTLPPFVSLTEMEGKVVLFSKKSGDFFGLNESAAFLVTELLKSNFQETVKAASKTFSVSPSELSGDLIELVGELTQQGLLMKLPAQT